MAKPRVSRASDPPFAIRHSPFAIRVVSRATSRRRSPTVSCEAVAIYFGSFGPPGLDPAMDDLTHFCCLNPACKDYGRRGGDHLAVAYRNGPQKQSRVLVCRTCKVRFSESKGTP